MKRREDRERESGSAASCDHVTSNYVTLDIDLYLSETRFPDLYHGNVLSSHLIMEGARWTQER